MQAASLSAAWGGGEDAGGVRAAVRGVSERERGDRGVSRARVRGRAGAARRVRGARRPLRARGHAALVRRRRRYVP